MAKKDKECFLFTRITGSSQNGPRRKLHGNTWEDPYSKTATGQKTKIKGQGHI